MPVGPNPPRLYPVIKVDGQFGSYTKEVWQRHLRVKGYYTGRIDASFGKLSWQGVQKWLRALKVYNRAIDGDPGTYTILALTSALAKYGFTVPGGSGAHWPNRYICTELQKYLNKHGRYYMGTYPKV